MKTNSLKHLLPVFGKKQISEIEAIDVARYQKRRLEGGASARSVNIDIETFRAILKRSGHWARILPDIRMLKDNCRAGKVLSDEECFALLSACSYSLSRNLLPIVLLGLETGARIGTIRKLQWKNVDLVNRCLTWGKDKTVSGTGRVVPLSEVASTCLMEWQKHFPHREPEHYVFQSERYSKTEGLRAAYIYDCDPTQPVGSIKTAWTAARYRAARILAGVPEPEEGKPSPEVPRLPYRFHDLRHTVYTRMRNGKVPIEIAGKILGWSPGQIVRMASIYGHFSLDDMRSAVEGSKLQESHLKSHLLQKVEVKQMVM
jgi:integrase